jgi:hypothetical protein
MDHSTRTHPSLQHLRRIMTGDLACEVNTGSLQYADNSMLFNSQIKVAFGNWGVANIKLPLLPLKSRSNSGRLLWEDVLVWERGVNVDRV